MELLALILKKFLYFLKRNIFLYFQKKKTFLKFREMELFSPPRKKFLLGGGGNETFRL